MAKFEFIWQCKRCKHEFHFSVIQEKWCCPNCSYNKFECYLIWNGKPQKKESFGKKVKDFF